MAVDLQEYRTDQQISELRHEMAHLTGVVEQLSERVSAFEARTDNRFASLENRMDSSLKWIIGLLLTSWITLAGLIIGLSLRGR